MVILAVGLVFLAIGVLIIRYSRKLRAEFAASLSWPGVSGHIISNEVLSHTESRDYGERDKVRYTAECTYEYYAGGSPQLGNRIRLTKTLFSTHNAAQAVLKSYPPGAEVTVYFDPNAPQSSVLDRSKPKGVTLMFVFGLAFAGFGVVATLIGIVLRNAI
jgi:hypothetical protein